MRRQVITTCPKTGRTIWTYVDLGAGAAKPMHGAGPIRGQMAGGGTTRASGFAASKAVPRKTA